MLKWTLPILAFANFVNDGGRIAVVGFVKRVGGVQAARHELDADLLAPVHQLLDVALRRVPDKQVVDFAAKAHAGAQLHCAAAKAAQRAVCAARVRGLRRALRELDAVEVERQRARAAAVAHRERDVEPLFDRRRVLLERVAAAAAVVHAQAEAAAARLVEQKVRVLLRQLLRRLVVGRHQAEQHAAPRQQNRVAPRPQLNVPRARRQRHARVRQLGVRVGRAAKLDCRVDGRHSRLQKRLCKRASRSTSPIKKVISFFEMNLGWVGVWGEGGRRRGKGEREKRRNEKEEEEASKHEW